jgi:DNA-binding PadR family transcriptional regulator
MPATPGLRMTLATERVLGVLLKHPDRDLYGHEICTMTRLPSGTVHPILARLSALGWLSCRWENADPREQGRPKRRYFQLNPDGADLARAAIRERGHG